MLRWIAHLDMDCFFVSVERLLDPSLVGKPVVVGGDPNGRGVVASASYEARRFGVRSAMASRKARELCPKLIFVSGSHRLYGEYHDRVRAILERYAPEIEAASIDEFYLDFTGCNLIYDGIFSLLRRIRAAIAAELGLPSTAALAANKLVAKIGSRLAKPAGVMWVPHGAEGQILAPLPVRAIPGVGPVTGEALGRLGVRTVGQLASIPEKALEAALGAFGPELARKARGASDAVVAEDGERKSVGHETTFGEDTADPVVLEATLCHLVEKAAWRLRLSGEQLGLFSAARDARLATLFPAVDRVRAKYGFDALELATSSLQRSEVVP